MSTTTRGLPYPGPGDVPNIPADIFALAEWLDAHLPSSGTYTPTVTLGSNASGGSASGSWMWLRVGDIMNVWGLLSMAATVAGDASVLVTLPAPSDLAATEDLVGVAAGDPNFFSRAGRILADTSGNKAEVTVTATGTTSRAVNAHFAYRVL